MKNALKKLITKLGGTYDQYDDTEKELLHRLLDTLKIEYNQYMPIETLWDKVSEGLGGSGGSSEDEEPETKSIVFSEYDDEGYPHNVNIVGLTKIPNKYFYNIFFKNSYSFQRFINILKIPNSVTSIGDSVFYGCSNLASIEIPDSVTSIGYEAFTNCINLTSITIPDGVTSIGKYTFENCSSLTSVMIPDSVTSIQSYAFKNCSSLTSITIPNSVKSIGESTFYGCSSLTSITIPNSVTHISSRALNIGSTTNKATITFKGTVPPTIATSTFSTASLNKIYVPSSAVETYKTATNWTTFASYIEADPNE